MYCQVSEWPGGAWCTAGPGRLADRRQSAEFSLPPHCSLLTHGQGQPEAPVRQHEVPGQDGEVAAVTVCPGVSHTITPSDTSVPLVRWGTVNHLSVSRVSIELEK